MLSYFLMIVAALLYIAAVYFLVRKYISTRNQGFVWLGIAFLVWPFVQNLLAIYKVHLVNALILGRNLSWLPFSSISPGTFSMYFQLVEAPVLPALLLIAIYYLGNTKNETREALA